MSQPQTAPRLRIGRRGAVRIAIAGSGLAGSYLYRLLKMRGQLSVDMFDIKHKIACHIHPCGYGVDEHFDPLVARVGLDPLIYRLHKPPHLLARVEGVTARTSICMIDKPRRVRDLLQEATVSTGPIHIDEYDMVHDATGEARAYAPPLARDLKARVIQWRVRVTKPATTSFLPTRGLPGYAWVMPLNEDGTDVHLGAGCQAGNRTPARTLVRPAFRSFEVTSVTCACGAHIRLGGPDFENIVAGKIWAVGEAAGLVGPASGAGNVFALQSALDLAENLGNPFGYIAALRRRFLPLVAEANAVRKIIAGRMPNPLDLYHVREGWRRAGVVVAWRDLPKLALSMQRAYTTPL